MSKYQSERLWLIGTVIIGTAINTSALGDDPPKADDTAEAMSHYIVQSIPPGVPVSGKPAPIKLTDEQRAKIRSVLATKTLKSATKKQPPLSRRSVRRFRRRSSRRHFREN